ncbi:hypothetical protein Q3G72_005011 [Acer saccharum]|nr:hypothetical protein Q3G72_005011 [Acer saccharum]
MRPSSKANLRCFIASFSKSIAIYCREEPDTTEQRTRSKSPRDEKMMQRMSWSRDSIVVRGFELLFFDGDQLPEVSVPLAPRRLGIS